MQSLTYDNDVMVNFHLLSELNQSVPASFLSSSTLFSNPLQYEFCVCQTALVAFRKPVNTNPGFTEVLILVVNFFHCIQCMLCVVRDYVNSKMSEDKHYKQKNSTKSYKSSKIQTPANPALA